MSLPRLPLVLFAFALVLGACSSSDTPPPLAERERQTHDTAVELVGVAQPADAPGDRSIDPELIARVEASAATAADRLVLGDDILYLGDNTLLGDHDMREVPAEEYECVAVVLDEFGLADEVGDLGPQFAGASTELIDAIGPAFDACLSDDSLELVVEEHGSENLHCVYDAIGDDRDLWLRILRVVIVADTVGRVPDQEAFALLFKCDLRGVDIDDPDDAISLSETQCVVDETIERATHEWALSSTPEQRAWESEESKRFVQEAVEACFTPENLAEFEANS